MGRMMSNPILVALQEHAATRGDARALRDDEDAVTYASLRHRVHDLARGLAETGAGRILLDTDNGIPWAVADLAAMTLGIMLTPIPAFFSPRQTKHIAATTAADLVLADQDRAARWEQDSLWQPLHLEGPLRAFARRSPASPPAGMALEGKVTFTSGSTGTPRGVLLGNDTIAATSAAIVTALAPLQPNEHVSVLPLATLLENIAGLYAPLMNGSAVYLPGATRTGLAGASLDVGMFRDLLAESNADTMILVPQLLTAVVTLVELGLLSLPTFRLIAVGGGRVAPALLERCDAVGLPVFEGYGLSECCSVLTLNLPGQRRIGSVGRPLAHAQLRISAAGEVEVKAPRMTGYVDGTCVAHGEGWYRTGDLGRLDNDGYLFIEGRSRNVFITSYGRNVNPEWPEAALMQHAALAQALVTGEGRDRNLALLWPRFELDDDAIRTLVDTANADLPDYAQVHQWIRMDEPLCPTLQTANGRLRRADVLAHYAAVIDAHNDDEPLSNKPSPDVTRNEHAVL